MSLLGKKGVWITWDDHRRSRELANEFNVEYFVLSCNYYWLTRYVYLAFRTFIVILKNKPRLVICQNPSVVLSVILCFLKNFFGFYLVVDRHSNFKLPTRDSRNMKWIAFHWLSDFSLRRADLTIVTNVSAKEYVGKVGAKAAILPDKVPDLVPLETYDLGSDFSFFFICTFSDDEPVEEVLEAFGQLRKDRNASIYVTGNFEKFSRYEEYVNRTGFNFLGYVDDEVYVNYLFSCDAVIVLTKMAMTLNCGSYEAVAAGKPQVAAKSKDIASYFYKGGVFPKDLSVRSLTQSFETMIDNFDYVQTEQLQFRVENKLIWKQMFDDLEMKMIEAL
jgi:glycosyltransferase involved in cell wall biosynthesis